MSLYISDKQFPKTAAPTPQDAPILLNAPQLQFHHRVFSGDFALSPLLLDTFQLANAGPEEKAYPLLPYSGFLGIFLFGGSASNASLCGPTTALKKLLLPPDSMAYCVRFRPGTVDCFTRIHANEFTDRAFPLLEHIKVPPTLLSALRRGESFHERNVFLTKQFIALDFANYVPSALIARCISLILSEHGMIKVSSVAKAAGCSERYINRVFQQRVGISTKLFCELIQLQFSLNTIVSARLQSLHDTALACGYFNQTHMNRAFRKFLDCTSGDIRCLNSGINLCQAASIL